MTVDIDCQLCTFRAQFAANHSYCLNERDLLYDDPHRLQFSLLAVFVTVHVNHRFLSNDFVHRLFHIFLLSFKVRVHMTLEESDFEH